MTSEIWLFSIGNFNLYSFVNVFTLSWHSESHILSTTYITKLREFSTRIKIHLTLLQISDFSISKFKFNLQITSIERQSLKYSLRNCDFVHSTISCTICFIFFEAVHETLDAIFDPCRWLGRHVAFPQLHLLQSRTFSILRGSIVTMWTTAPPVSLLSYPLLFRGFEIRLFVIHTTLVNSRPRWFIVSMFWPASFKHPARCFILCSISPSDVTFSSSCIHTAGYLTFHLTFKLHYKFRIKLWTR